MINKSDKRLITNASRLMNVARGKNAAQLRKQYSELRSIAQKRLIRGGAALLDVEDFAKLRDLKSPSDLAKEYVRVSKFLRQKRSTAKGRAQIARSTVVKLKEQGLKNVDKTNVDQFGQFMDMIMRRYEMDTPEGKRLLFDSDKAMDIFDELTEEGKINEDSNLSAMSRAFNNYLRSEGREDLIVKPKRRRKRS